MQQEVEIIIRGSFDVDNSSSSIKSLVQKILDTSPTSREILLQVMKVREEAEIYGLNETSIEFSKIELEDYLEAHYDIVEYITNHNEDKYKPSVVTETQEREGSGGLYMLAKKWADEFDQEYRGTDWGVEKDYLDTMEAFLIKKDKVC